MREKRRKRIGKENGGKQTSRDGRLKKKRINWQHVVMFVVWHSSDRQRQRRGYDGWLLKTGSPARQIDSCDSMTTTDTPFTSADELRLTKSRLW
jgi:hypothetical protein